MRADDSSADPDLRRIEDFLDDGMSEDELRVFERDLANRPALAHLLVRLGAIETGLDRVYRRGHGRASHSDASKVRRVRRRAAAVALSVAAASAAVFLAFQRRTHEGPDDGGSGYAAQAPGNVPAHARAAPRGQGADPSQPITYNGQPVFAVGWPGDPPGMAKAEVVARYDFEKPARGYPGWVGERGSCPSERGPTHCLRGVRMRPTHTHQLGVTLGDWERTAFAYTHDLFVSFRYWVGDTTGRDPALCLVLYRAATGEAFRLDHRARLHARWNQVTLPLSAVRGWNDPEEVLSSGDLISALHITIPYVADDVLLVDDVQLVRYVPATDSLWQAPIAP